MIKTVKLDSGIRVVLEEIPYVQSVAIGVWVKAGAVDEEPAHAGISHFIEHMMFKGTGTRTARQIAEEVDNIGGQINAFTGKEATCYYVKTLSTSYRKAADVIVDMLTDSLLTKEDLDKERQVVCEEIKMTMDTPDDLAHDTITSMVFKGKPLGNSILGTPSTLNKITHNVMADHISREYTRDSIVISIAGNFDEDDILGYFDDKLTSLTPSKETKKHEETAYEPSFKSITRKIEQAHICMAVRAVDLYDEDYYAFSTLCNIMGGSMSSRLFQNIREEKGLAYSVYSSHGAFSSDGYFNIYAGVSHDKIKAAAEGIKEEIRLLADAGVTADELESSIEQLKSNYIFNQENIATRMFKNGKNVTLAGRTFTQEEIISGYDGVTMDDISRMIGLITDINQYSAVIVTRDRVDIKKIVRD